MSLMELAIEVGEALQGFPKIEQYTETDASGQEHAKLRLPVPSKGEDARKTGAHLRVRNSATVGGAVRIKLFRPLTGSDSKWEAVEFVDGQGTSKAIQVGEAFDISPSQELDFRLVVAVPEGVAVGTNREVTVRVVQDDEPEEVFADTKPIVMKLSGKSKPIDEKVEDWPPKLKGWVPVPASLLLLLAIGTWVLWGKSGTEWATALAGLVTIPVGIGVAIAAGVIGKRTVARDAAGWNFAWAGISASAVMVVQGLIVIILEIGWVETTKENHPSSGGALIILWVVGAFFYVGLPGLALGLAIRVLHKARPEPATPTD